MLWAIKKNLFGKKSSIPKFLRIPLKKRKRKRKSLGSKNIRTNDRYEIFGVSRPFPIFSPSPPPPSIAVSNPCLVEAQKMVSLLFSFSSSLGFYFDFTVCSLCWDFGISTKGWTLEYRISAITRDVKLDDVLKIYWNLVVITVFPSHIFFDCADYWSISVF